PGGLGSAAGRPDPVRVGGVRPGLLHRRTAPPQATAVRIRGRRTQYPSWRTVPLLGVRPGGQWRSAAGGRAQAADRVRVVVVEPEVAAGDACGWAPLIVRQSRLVGDFGANQAPA